MDIQSLLGAAAQKAPPSAGAALGQNKGDAPAIPFKLPEDGDAAIQSTADQLDLPGLLTKVEVAAQTAVLTVQTPAEDAAAIVAVSDVTISVEDGPIAKLVDRPIAEVGAGDSPDLFTTDMSSKTEDATREDADVPPTLPAPAQVDVPAPSADVPAGPATPPVAIAETAPVVAREETAFAPQATRPAPAEITPDAAPAPRLPEAAVPVPRGTPQIAAPAPEAAPTPDTAIATPDTKTAVQSPPQPAAAMPAAVPKEVPQAAIPLPPGAAIAPEAPRRMTQPAPEVSTEDLSQPREARADAVRTLSDIAPVPRPQTTEPAPMPQPSTAQGALAAPDTPVKPSVADSGPMGELAKFVEIAPATDTKGTQSTLSTQTPGTMAPEPTRPPTLQIVEALRLAPGTVDLVLVPEELGRLTLSMAMDDGTMAVTVTAERAETLDLVRRNATLLEAEARAAGFDNVSFTFSENGSTSGGDSDGAQGGADGSDGPALPGGSDDTQPDVAALPVSGSLDLRL